MIKFVMINPSSSYFEIMLKPVVIRVKLTENVILFQNLSKTCVNDYLLLMNGAASVL